MSEGRPEIEHPQLPAQLFGDQNNRKGTKEVVVGICIVRERGFGTGAKDSRTIK
jgi:hypothetical protein